MTKETKIGLLVGLAFIVLFAIILSEKGARRGVESPAFDMASGPGGPESNGAPLQDGIMPVERQLPPLVEPRRESVANANRTSVESPAICPEDAQVASTGNSPAPSLPRLPEELVQILNQPVHTGAGTPQGSPGSDLNSDGDPIDMSPIMRSSVAQNQPRNAPITPNATPAGNTASLVPTHPSSGLMFGANNATPSTNDHSSLAQGPASSDRAAPSTVRTEPVKPRPVLVKAVHQIEPGQSLGKIAALYYGRSTPNRVQAIFEANRDVLKDIHSVRAGDTLKIPDLGDDESAPPTRSVAFEEAPAFAGANMTTSVPVSADGRLRIPKPLPDSAANAPISNNEPRRTELAASTPDGRRPVPSTRAVARNYVIQPGDTLSGIARRELGNEKRYNEIYRMNTDRLPNNHALKPGTEIRLPINDAKTSGLTIHTAMGADAD